MLRQALLVLCVVGVGMVLGHTRMREPPNRSSLWREPEFANFNPTPNYVDDQLWCDNVRQYEVDNRCGVCGDPLDQARPRDNENGGLYGLGVITRRYSPGQTIPIAVEFPAPHGGYFQIQICDRLPETEDCFRTLTLGNGQNLWPMRLGDGDFWIETTAQLPSDIRCEQCTLRLHYRGAQNWGDCDDSASCDCDPTGTGGMGCGPQQTFRSCADISVL